MFKIWNLIIKNFYFPLAEIRSLPCPDATRLDSAEIKFVFKISLLNIQSKFKIQNSKFLSPV